MTPVFGAQSESNEGFGQKEGVAAIARCQAQGLPKHAVGGFQTGFPHPMWCTGQPAGGEVDRRSDLDADRDTQRLVILMHPAFPLGLAHREEQNIGLGCTDASDERFMLVVRQILEQGASVPAIRIPGN